MSTPMQALAQRIHGELEDLDRVVRRALARWDKAEQFPEETAYIEAVALNLHILFRGRAHLRADRSQH